MKNYWYRYHTSQNKHPDRENGSDREADSSKTLAGDSSVTAIQPKLTLSQPNDSYEQEADAMANQVVTTLHPQVPVVQQKCEECEQEEQVQKSEIGEGTMMRKPVFESDADPPDETVQRKALSSAPPLVMRAETAASAETPQPELPAKTEGSGQWIVSDDASPEAGQMTKSEFLTRLNTAVCSATDEALSGTPFSSDTCPYIRRAFNRHRKSTPAQIEKTLHRYEPQTHNAASANDLISIVRNRAFQAVNQWKSSGDLSGVPPEIASQIPGSVKMMAQAMGALGGVGSSIMSGVSAVASGLGSVASAVGGLFFKGKPGGAHAMHSPEAVRDSLGSGQSLDGHTRSQMEGAFGTSFADVQLHTDSKASTLSQNMNAKAFTVGNHVAFGQGEYKPGNPVGDALIAHELAHVVQQRGGGKQLNTKSYSSNSHHVLEKEADHAALHATSRIWGRKNAGAFGKLKLQPGGLRISRCGGNKDSASKNSAKPVVPTLDEIKKASRSDLDTYRKDSKILDELQKNLSNKDFGIAAAYMMLVVPSTVVKKDDAKKEAIRILSAQLGGDKAVTRNAIDNKVEVVIVPRNKLMTDLTQFSSLKGKKTFDGRTWDPVRGSGGMKVGSKVYTAITEENLLGGNCDITYNGSKLNCQYDEGYSTTSHEFAHTLHNYALTSADKKAITDAYNARKTKAATKPNDSDQWVDGRQGCYASQTEHEFFAQLSNAYLGTNGGTDPYVGDTRHNTKKWVEDHEPEMFKILERIYAGASVANTNPKP